ncbi:MAG TPA: PHB depolymerase family esterase [Candidatus Acidoferrales bacterium]
MRRLAIFLVAVIVLPSIACSASPNPSFELQSGGRTRNYSFHTPKNYDSAKPWPLIFVIHGRLGTGEGMARIAHFDEFAESNGIIAVYPNGVDHSWNDGRGTGPAGRKGVDDVAFFSAMLDKIESSYSIDASRVYATGLSNGGFMSYDLACNLAARIAAIAPVGATFSVPLSQQCHPARAISVLAINGTDDPLVPYTGGEMKRGSGGMILSAEDSAKAWARLDGCSATATQDTLPAKSPDGLETRREIYSGCHQNSAVALYSVVGGGHTWPGGKQYLPQFLVGKTSRDFAANEVIWQFFQAHPLPAAKP